MVFGLFGKKEELKKPELKKPKPPGSSSSSSSSSSSGKTGPQKIDAKIDLLEAEMTLDFARPGEAAAIHTKNAEASRNTAKSGDSSLDFSAMPSPPPAPALSVPAAAQGPASTLNMEISSSPFEKAPVIEEAAILYANGDDEGAISALKHSIEHDNLPRGVAPQVWLLLFDLYQSTGRRAEFDSLSLDYTVRFELSSPTWIDPQSAGRDPSLATGGGSYFSFTGNLDYDSTKQFEQIKKIAERSKILRIEFGKIDTISPEGCQMLWKALNAFKQSGHDLVLSGAPHLVGKLTGAVETGRNTDPQVYWLLLLDLYQLQVMQAEFEEAALNYCITYEVSPPSWEEPKKAAKKPTTAPPPAQGPETVSIDVMRLEGELLNGADTTIAAMREFAADKPYPAFDVGQVKRIDFASAGALLNLVTVLHKGEAHAELRNCGHMIGALFAVLGFQNHARISKKK